MSVDGQGTKWRRNSTEILIGWVVRTNVTDDRQTDDRRTDDSIYVHVRQKCKDVFLEVRYHLCRVIMFSTFQFLIIYRLLAIRAAIRCSPPQSVEAPSGERLRGKAGMVFIAGKAVWSMLSALKWSVYHARRYTSALLLLFTFLRCMCLCTGVFSSTSILASWCQWTH